MNDIRKLTGRITQAQISPMAVVLSWVDITVTLLNNQTIEVRVEDTIENLKNRLGFEVKGDVYRMQPMIGRKCEIIDNGTTYHFSKYI